MATANQLYVNVSVRKHANFSNRLNENILKSFCDSLYIFSPPTDVVMRGPSAYLKTRYYKFA